MSDKGLYDYIGEWGRAATPAKGVDDGAGGDGGDYEGNVQAAVDNGVDAFGLEKDEFEGPYGQGPEIKVVKDHDTWGMKASEVEKGFSGGDGYDDGQYHQDIPQKNEHDRGAGSEARAKEFSSTEGRGFDGRGHDRSDPGGQQIGTADYPSAGPEGSRP